MAITESFQALRSFSENGRVVSKIVELKLDDLSAGDVVVKVHYSSVNYKDALAATGKGKILRQTPLNPGIDLAGSVVSSNEPGLKEGDEVLVTGCGIGENYDGGYSEYARVRSQDVIKLPDNLSLRESMILGTAGFTAGLCVARMKTSGQTPDMGPIVVTGASGGVGSLALALLKKAGFQTVAISSKKNEWDWLRKVGADEVMSPEDLDLGARPLESVRFGGAIDNVGGELLEGILRHTQLWGNVASVGLAADHKFSSTVMPFILRGVSLLGISSANCPMNLRQEVWQSLAGPIKPDHLEDFVSGTYTLSELMPVFDSLLDRKNTGRNLVRFC